jgi:hypothetical protein
MGGQTVLPRRPGGILLTDERPDALLSCPDGNMGSDFSELESVQNLP